MKTTSAAHQSNEGNASAVTGISRVTMGAAALGTVFTLPVAVDAAIVYSGVQNISVTLTGSQRNASNYNSGPNTATIGLNLDGNAVDDFKLLVRQSYDFFSSQREGTARLQGQVQGNIVLASGFSTARNLASSNLVGGGDQSGAGSALLRRATAGFEGQPQAAGNFPGSQTGIAGVAFDIDGSTHYGWIRLHVEEGPGGFPVGITAIDWAYQSTANTPIHVPDTVDVPEANPGLVLLAAGGTGLVAWRLRRRKEAKQTAQA